jgi:glutamate synthase (NADPH/NADH) small chain
VLGINEPPVAIKMIEKAIIDVGWSEGWVHPQAPTRQTWKRVAVVGSGPAGLAGAQQLARAGHQVTVFEKSDRLGGLLCYGIPDFKMERHIIDRRVQQMMEEGVVFRTSTEAGKDIPARELLSHFDAVLLAGGAQQARLLPQDVAGRDLRGIHLAMDFLPQQNRRNQGDILPPDEDILATGKTVVVLGGGDTGSDCIGTSHRQGAREVLNFELLGKPPKVKTSTSHEEGGQRRWGVLTKGFEGKDGRVTALRAVEVEWVMPGNNGGPPQMREIPGSEFVQPADLVLLAMGFTGPVWNGLLTDLGVAATERGAVQRDRNYMTSQRGIFVAGDMTRGASLVVWAIAEGREAATAIDRYLRAQ